MNRQELKQRLRSAFILISGLVVIIFFLPRWISGLTVVLLTALALYEFFNLIEKKGIFVSKCIGIIIGIFIIVNTYVELELTHGLELPFIAVACLLVFVLQLRRRDSSEAIVGISTTLFGIIYVAWLFSFILKVRLMPQNIAGLPDGRLLVIFLLLVTKMGDAGAYFAGSRWGKHILLQRVSPKKTVEGLIGAVCLSIVVAGASKAFLPSIPIWHLLSLGFLLGGIGQIGDLTESLIKRDCKIKDAGSLFPGLGGVLDLIDSLLFAAPIFYIYLKVLYL